jgi:hypothetical protein
MLKAVSSITNAIGALNYKGIWNASTNTPNLASGSGTKGDYYVVSVAGSTSLDGISNWGIGDWAAFNGATWQRVEGGADLNGVNLSVSGVASFADGTAAAPSMTNTGDTNTGLYFPAEDAVGIVTNGVERVRYKSDGFDYNPKKQLISFNPWPGNTTDVPNFAYAVLSNSQIPIGQEYLAVFSGLRVRTSNLNATLCTGMTITIGYCDNTVGDGGYTNQTVDPTGFTALQTFTTGWETVDPGDGYTPYNDSSGFGWIFPKCMSFPIPFTFNVANKKLVWKFKFWGTGGSVLSNESQGLIRIYQITASSAT